MPYRLHISEDEVREELKRLGYTQFSNELISSFRKDLIKLIKADIKQFKKEKSLLASQHSGSSGFATSNSYESNSQPSADLSSGSSGSGQSYQTSLSRSISQPSLRASTSTNSPVTGYEFNHTSTDTQERHSDQKTRRQKEPQHHAKSRQEEESGYSESESEATSYSSSRTSSTSSGFNSGSSVTTSQPAVQPASRQKRAPSLPPYPRKRWDPVSLYHFYRAHWEARPPPGEDPRTALRWKVRADLFYSK